MRLKYFQVVSILLLSTSVILASCGGGGGGGGTAGGNTATSLAMKGTSGNAVNMNGTWTACNYSATDQENERQVLTLNGGSATMNLSVWQAATNGNCTQTATPDILLNVTVTATLDSGPTSTAIWVDGNGAVSTPPAGISATAKATKATLVFNSATATLGSDAYVNNFNTNSVCGGGWVKNVAKNVLNCTAVIATTTETDYWVVDDSAAQLKWYSGATGVAWQVDNVKPMLK